MILSKFVSVFNVKWIFIFFIIIYQKLISPFLGSRCRFFPSCSEYAKQAFIKHGFCKGLFFAIIRLFKCNPFHPGGIDNVP